MIHASKRGKTIRTETRLPAQELADFKNLLASLEHEETCDVGQTLSVDAQNRRHIQAALSEAHVNPEPSDWRQLLGEHALDVIRRHPMLLWPLSAADVPSPNWLLSEEVAALTKEQLNPYTQGQLWIAIQACLHATLFHIAWSEPASISPESLQREVNKCKSNPTMYRADALRAFLQYRHWNLDRHAKARTLDWRDILQHALISENVALVNAAEQVLELMSSLYHARPREVHLEKRTWLINDTPDILQRASLLRRARDLDVSYNVMDHVYESIDGSDPLADKHDARKRAEEAFLWDSDATSDAGSDTSSEATLGDESDDESPEPPASLSKKRAHPSPPRAAKRMRRGF